MDENQWEEEGEEQSQDELTEIKTETLSVTSFKIDVPGSPTSVQSSRGRFDIHQVGKLKCCLRMEKL